MPTRAAAESPFGTTIAHGFLTLSLLSALMRDADRSAGCGWRSTTALNRVRFVSPVPAGARIRARVTLLSLTDVDQGAQAAWQVVVEREHAEKPCLVAEWLLRYYPDGPR